MKTELIYMTRGYKTKSPTGINPMTSQTPGGRSIHWVTRTNGEQGHLKGLSHGIFSYFEHQKNNR